MNNICTIICKILIMNLVNHFHLHMNLLKFKVLCLGIRTEMSRDQCWCILERQEYIKDVSFIS